MNQKIELFQEHKFHIIFTHYSRCALNVGQMPLVPKRVDVSPVQKKKMIKQQREGFHNKNSRVSKMVDDIKHEHEEAVREREIDLEKANTIVAEVEVCAEMAKNEEKNKELDRKHTNKGSSQWKLIAISC